MVLVNGGGTSREQDLLTVCVPNNSWGQFIVHWILVGTCSSLKEHKQEGRYKETDKDIKQTEIDRFSSSPLFHFTSVVALLESCWDEQRIEDGFCVQYCCTDSVSLRVKVPTFYCSITA